MRCGYSIRLFLTAAIVPATLLGVVPSAIAAITSSGEVNPSTVTPVNTGAELQIGVGSSPQNVDPRAYVTVIDSTLDYDQIFIGYDDGFFGNLIASGATTLIQVRDAGPNSDAAVEVGRHGYGYFSLTDGARLHTFNSGGDIVIASDAGSIGEMVVDGWTTFADIEEDFLVGDAGAGKLTISGGALVRTTETDSLFSIGDKATGSGYALVTGDQTVLQLGDDLAVGRLGVGELVIADNALVQSYNHLTNTPQATISTLGKVSLAGGVLDYPDTNVDGYLGGHGTVRGQVDVATTGVVEVGPGELLNLNNAFNNSGAATVTDGEIRLLDTATTSATGRYTLEDGVLRFTQAHTNDGVIASAEGTNNIHGAITNNGTIVVASESVAVFNDSVTGPGTINVLARGNALFLADLTFTASSQIALGVSASNGANEPAQIEVAGQATLAGELMIDLPADYSPATAQSIELIFAAGGLTIDQANFVPPVFPTIEGLEFDLLQTANSLLLDVQVDTVTLLDGDFNNDGTVDAADYAVWRNGFGTTYSIQDYNLWRAHYGQSLAPSAQAPTAAPEPTALLCLLISAGLAATRRR